MRSFEKNERWIWIYIILAAMAMALASCKTAARRSDARSIDAITTGDSTLRNHDYCGEGSQDLTGTSPEDNLLRVFGSLPEGLRNGFFVDMAQSFDIAKDQDELSVICGAAIEEAKKLQKYTDVKPAEGVPIRYNACWTVINKRPVVHVLKDSAAIHRNMLAMATYAFMEFYIDDLFSLSGAASAIVDEVKRLRLALAKAVISDLSQHDLSSDQLAVYRERFGYDAETLDRNIPLQNYFLAEVVDSYYCSPKSHEQFMQGELAGKPFHESVTAFKLLAVFFSGASTDGKLGKTWFGESLQLAVP